MPRLTRSFVAAGSRSFAIAVGAAAIALSLAACDKSTSTEVRGPVEGKRLNGTETALKTPVPANPAADPAKDQKLPGDDLKKKRDEWRDKKTGKPDENDPIAKANIELRPSLNPDTSKTTPATIPAPDPTALAKPLTDPAAPVPFADPNNPDFVPADRNIWKKFDIKKLKEADGHLVVPFADLSGFPYSSMVGAPQPPADEKDAKAPKKPEFAIPDSIKALDGKKVVITGYMMPIDFEDGGTNEFVITRNIPSCFYCQPPQLNDWIEVKIKDGKRVPYVPDGVVELYGTLSVGEQHEDGFVVNLYRMTGTKLVEPKPN